MLKKRVGLLLIAIVIILASYAIVTVNKKDDNGLKHTVYNLCPHMKCSLTFNEVEKTWDCPCHGSRFDIDGKCTLGPSNYDISYKQ